MALQQRPSIFDKRRGSYHRDPVPSKSYLPLLLRVACKIIIRFLSDKITNSESSTDDVVKKSTKKLSTILSISRSLIA